MTETTASEKIMERVAALLRIAEHPNTPGPEAETALMQANKLITKHAIDEALLRQSQSVGDRRAIKQSKIALGTGEFTPYLSTIFMAAAEALRVSVGTRSARIDGVFQTEYWVYGADEDVAWLEMLFNMIKLQFLLKLDPKWDESLGYDANVYNFKVAGFKWAEIDRKAMSFGHASRESTEAKKVSRYALSDEERANSPQVTGDPAEPTMWDMFEVRRPNGFYHKLKAAYVRHAKVISDDTRVVTQSHEAYRLSFATAFRSTMCNRFYEMQREAEAEMDTIPGAAIAIRDMKAEADEALWADFPDMSPEEIARRREAMRAQREAEAKAREEMLAAMTSAERQRFLEEEEEAERRQAKAQRRWEKQNTKYYSRDLSATQRGSAAAMSVDLTRKAGSAGAASSRGELT
jgi:hypothetical protein